MILPQQPAPDYPYPDEYGFTMECPRLTEKRNKAKQWLDTKWLLHPSNAVKKKEG